MKKHIEYNLNSGNSKLIKRQTKIKNVVNIINKKEILSQQNGILLFKISIVVNILNELKNELPVSSKFTNRLLYNNNDIKKNTKLNNIETCFINKLYFFGINTIISIANKLNKIKSLIKNKSLKKKSAFVL